MKGHNTSRNSSNLIVSEAWTLSSFTMACKSEWWHRSNISVVNIGKSRLKRHSSVFSSYPSLIRHGHSSIMERFSYTAPIMFIFWIPLWLHHADIYYLRCISYKVQATAQMKRLSSPMLVQLPPFQSQTSSSNSWKDWGFVWLSGPKMLGN